MNKRRLMQTSSAAIVALATAPCLGIAHAQTAPQADDDKREIIIVTGTRRDESVQDTPINIAAVGGAEIEEEGLVELSDLAAVIPGLTVVDQGPRAGNPIIVRGLNADPIGAEEGVSDGGGTVATYVGEIPVYIDLKLEDLERVEVLLGPQGTLYGAGTLGGAIRYIPRKPDTTGDTLELRSSVYGYSEASDASYDVGFTFNKALGDKFAIRGTLGYLSDSGFIDYPFVVQEIGVSEPDPNFADPAARAANFAPAEDANGQDMLSGRIAARWLPTDWLDATLSYYYQQQDIEGRTISSKRSTVPAGEYEAGMRVREPNDRQQELLALEVIADLGFAELTSASGYGRYEEHGQRDQTDLLITLEYSYEAFPEFAAFTREDVEDEFVTQEMRLVSQMEGPLSWIVGGFYNHRYSYGVSQEFTPGFNDFVVTDFGFDFRPDALEYYSADYTHLIEKAFFGEVSYDITPQWDVTLGARQYEYTFRTASDQDFPLLETGLGRTPNDAIVMELTDAGQEDDGWLYKFNTSWQPNDDLLLYLTVSQGFRIGNSNGLAPCPGFDPLSPQGSCALAPGQQYGPGAGDIAQFDERQYGPDKTQNYEIGFKSSLLDGDLIFNGAAFFIEWEDPQVGSATVNAAIPITINANGAESKGVEFSADWFATEQLRLRGSYSYAKSELTEDVPDLITTIAPPGFATTFEDGLAGDRLPGSPENQFAFFADYEQPLSGDATLNYRLGYSWQDDVLTRTGGRGGSLTLDSYGVANASVTYDAGAWAVTGFVKNLFDEYIETGARSTARFNQTINGANVRSFYTNVAPPLTFGVRFRYRLE
ncbi:MAG: TonB-dependent receptor [Hyphomonadaceae bacterium]|nr:TonB-dependent receptor [Hyphomonadaceae bacterium]